MAAAEIPRLAVELDLYSTCKADWLVEHPGEYVVIKTKKVLGFYSTFQAAYSAGASEFGIDTDFLVKRIVWNEPIFCLF